MDNKVSIEDLDLDLILCALRTEQRAIQERQQQYADKYDLAGAQEMSKQFHVVSREIERIKDAKGR